ncbi:hypothetical protein HispidOSU_021190, partial [Sigmodon hispidus]
MDQRGGSRCRALSLCKSWGPPGVAGLIQIPPAAAVIRRDSASICTRTRGSGDSGATHLLQQDPSSLEATKPWALGVSHSEHTAAK